MNSLISNLERFWCQTMHDATMWPIHGRYRCATCLREYSVPFAETRGADEIVYRASATPRTAQL